MSISAASSLSRRFAVVALVVALVSGVACDVDAATSPGCPPATGSTIGITGVQPAKYRNTRVGVGTVIDARGASWTAVGSYPVHLAGGSTACWTGGRITGTYDATVTWDALHDTGALNLFLPSTELRAVRVHNYGDGLRILDGADDFRIRGVHLSYIRDDCIEDDRLFGGQVDDSLLDGCYVAFSARRHSNDTVSSGAGEVWSITNSLVRLQPMPTVYRGPAPGHGGFFKWDLDGRGPKLSLRGNVFRADQRSNHTTMGIPPGALADCADNVMVWLGAGDYPEPLPSCFTITRDVGVWDRAVEAWTSTHVTG